MASKIKVDQIEGSAGSTVSLPSGQTLDLSSGSITLPDSAVDLSSAKVTGILGTGNLPNIPEANLPTIPVSKGGTGVTSLGSAGEVIKVNSGGTALEFGTVGGGGKVLQVLTATDNNERSTTSTSFITAGTLSISITPSATTSKIFLMVSSGRLFSDGPHAVYSLFRGSTNLGDSNNGFQDCNDSQSRQIISTHLDSPSTTSAIIYTVKFRTKNGSYNAYFNSGSSPTRGGNTSSAPARGSFTAMEIGV